MSDSQNLPIQPTPPVRSAGSVQPVRYERPAGTPAEPRPEPGKDAAAATTGGNLRPAYAEFIVDPDSKDVVIRIKDSTTDAVLSEYPSKEVQAMTKHLRDYADVLARRRASLLNGSGA